MLSVGCWRASGGEAFDLQVEISTVLQVASPVAKETYSVSIEEALANACPEMYALLYNSSHKSTAKFAFTKKHCNY